MPSPRVANLVLRLSRPARGHSPASQPESTIALSDGHVTVTVLSSPHRHLSFCPQQRKNTLGLTTRLMAIVMSSASISIVANAQLAAPGRARLDSLRQSPEVAGALIYQGTVFALHGSAAEPLFRYERRVQATPFGMSATHATQDAKGSLIIDESTQVSATYEFQRFTVANAQTGISGSVVSSREGRHLEYVLDDNGRVSTAAEEVRDPVVTGPSMHGFIRQHWDVLTSGQTIRVRLIVFDRKTTYPFDLRMMRRAAGQTTFSATPSSFFVRLAIKPLHVVFDDSVRGLVRYEGRVPPKRAVAAKLKNLDARVEYRMVSRAYR